MVNAGHIIMVVTIVMMFGAVYTVTTMKIPYDVEYKADLVNIEHEAFSTYYEFSNGRVEKNLNFLDDKVIIGGSYELRTSSLGRIAVLCK